MLAVIFLLTASVLVLVHAQLRTHVRRDLISTLQAESAVYTEIESARREEARQGALLIADQPSLKALMSTNDRPTIQDGAASLWQTSQSDLLVLQSSSGQVLGFFAKSNELGESWAAPLLQATSGSQDWWVSGGHLFDVNVVPIVAGAGEVQHILGRIALGREVSPQAIHRTDLFGNSSLIFERDGKVVLSSLTSEKANLFQAAEADASIRDVTLAGEHYLASSAELSGDHPVRLHFLQSYDQATAFLNELDRTLYGMGILAIVVGALVVFGLSRQITQPIERLVYGTRQLEEGNYDFTIPLTGKDEVAALTRSFIEMRNHLKQSRESMLRSARLEAVGRLAGGVAHDFNNLVMIIKGYSELVQDAVPPEVRPQLEEIKRAGDRASGLTRQLLAFSRKQVLEPQVLDPNQIVSGMVKMLRVLIGEDIELVTNLSEQAGRVQVDPGQLEQVIMNLAVNARDAMPTGGKLVIETHSCVLDDTYSATHSDVAPGPFVLIAVTDTGHGMKPEVLAHIFEPFFTTKDAGRGTGLGLATVYGIVKQSRGDIGVYSEPGMGTTFKIYLPAVNKASASPSSASSATLTKGEGTILLVEDEAPLRTLTAETLRRLGYTVLQAGNGLEAIAVSDAHAGAIDILITDIVMPRMGGPELVEQLRQKRMSVRVIFMSGYTEAAALENLKLGADAVLLTKPFSTEMLARRVSEFCKPASKAAAAK